MKNTTHNKHYQVKYQMYQYNSGKGDNGYKTLVKSFPNYKAAKAFRDDLKEIILWWKFCCSTDKTPSKFDDSALYEHMKEKHEALVDALYYDGYLNAVYPNIMILETTYIELPEDYCECRQEQDESHIRHTCGKEKVNE